MGISTNRTNIGFTIVELLIVVVVIAILATITIVAYNGVTTRASDSAAKADMKTIITKLELEKATSSTYPLTASGLTGVTAGNDIRIEYTSDGSTYCITTSSIRAKTDYYKNDTSGDVISGKCPNHLGYQGGAGMVDTPSVIASSIFGSSAPVGGYQVYNDGGGSLWVGNRFYTMRDNGIQITGARVWEPPTATAGFLSTSISVQVFTQDYQGSGLGGWNGLGSAVISATYSGTRTAGTWTYIPFPSTTTIAKSSAAAGPKDSVTIAVRYDGAYYVSANPAMYDTYTESNQVSAVYLSEHGYGAYGRAVSNVYPTTSATYYYGIDILFNAL